MTTITPLAIPDVLLITPKRHGDARGWFAETWSVKALAGTVADTTFVQDNQAFSAAKGTLRGLHFQLAPNAQGKLIRALAHGYCTITDDCEIFYKVDGPYAPQSEGGIIWNDPDLAIPWPLDGEPLLSQKDTVLPRLKDLGPVAF